MTTKLSSESSPLDKKITGINRRTQKQEALCKYCVLSLHDGAPCFLFSIERKCRPTIDASAKQSVVERERVPSGEGEKRLQKSSRFEEGGMFFAIVDRLSELTLAVIFLYISFMAGCIYQNYHHSCAVKIERTK